MPKSPIIDPTANVLGLVGAAVKRLDDLQASEASHVREVLELRSLHWTAMSEKESQRIDANRQFDQLAVTTLAARREQDAAALRNLVDTTASAAQASLTAMMETVNARLAALEKSSYEGKGRGGGMSQLYVWALGAIAAIATLYALLGGKH